MRNQNHTTTTSQTNENIKQSYLKLGNPYAKGLFDNLKRLFSKDKRNWHPE